MTELWIFQTETLRLMLRDAGAVEANDNYDDEYRHAAKDWAETIQAELGRRQ